MLKRSFFKSAFGYSHLVFKRTLTSRRLITQKFLAHQHLRSPRLTSIIRQTHTEPKESTSHENPFTTTKHLLEKYMASISTSIHIKNRVYKNDLVRCIKMVKDNNFSTKKQGLLLLRCCSDLIVDETPTTRIALAEDVWSALTPHTIFETAHYDELLKVYIHNNRTIKVSFFIEQMAPAKPTVTTYELMLRVLGEAGDINQSTEVISNMKSLGIPATVNIFNSLIICHGKRGNLDGIKEILTMMKSLNLEPNHDTYVATARAYALSKKDDMVMGELEKAVKIGKGFSESQIMEVVKSLASVAHYDLIPRVLLYLPQGILNTPSINPYMQSVATQLVFQNHPLAALQIYNALAIPSFGPNDDKGLHGRAFIRDCVKANIPSKLVMKISEDLMASGRSPTALHIACEAALQMGKLPLALELFSRLKHLDLPLRPHYFWPIILHNYRSYGEKGVMNSLQTMIAMDVKPDYETISSYVLPHVSFTSPQTLMKKFLEHGLTVNMVLTPMMETLLNEGQVRAAAELCELFQGKIKVEKLLKPLVKGFLESGAITPTMQLLQDVRMKAANKDFDLTGRFLCELLQSKKSRHDISSFAAVVKELKKKNLNISLSVADFCIAQISECCDEKTRRSLKDMLISISDDTIPDSSDISPQQMHPRTMDEENLRAHLNELEAKGMNTRGVLRKLLQLYCRQGNLSEAKAIAKKCENEGVFLSAGMKASILDLHVRCGELEDAKKLLKEVKRNTPQFLLDEFKVIDLATLMVNKSKTDEAFDFISDESKKRRITGGRSIEKNCLKLLESIALMESYHDTLNMFNLLTAYNYCAPTNVILGPLVRAHLNQFDLQSATEEFVRIGGLYKKTPLKHELLCKLLTELKQQIADDRNRLFRNSSEAEENLKKMISSVLGTVRLVHGNSDVQITLMSALAQVGDVKSLRRMFQDPNVRFHPEALMRRCQRFAYEKNGQALINIAECGKDNLGVDLEAIYELILDVYQREDNVKGALDVWNKVQEGDLISSKKIIQGIALIVTSNRGKLPKELLTLLDDKDKEKLNLTTS